MKKKKLKAVLYVKNSDGTPFTDTGFSKTDWEEVIRRWQEAKDEIKANLEKANLTKVNTQPSSNLHWDYVGPKIDAGRKLTEKQFREEFAAIRHFLEGEKNILPANTNQFLEWFIKVKYGRKPISEMLSRWPNIVPADFNEFHNYKKYLYEHGGEIGDIIPTPESNISIEDTVSPQLNKGAKNTDRSLPPLKEVIKDAESFLPKLSGALAGMPRPFGVSALMALAQVLITKGRVSGKYSTEQVYRMLCRHFEETESDRPRIKTPTGFTYAYSDRLATFDDLLQGS